MIKLSLNEFEDHNEHIGVYQTEPEQHTFLKVEEIDKYVFGDILNSFGIPEMYVRFQLSQKKKNHERENYTMLQLIGDSGGFNGSVIGLTTFLLGSYNQQMFETTIFKEMPVKKKRVRQALQPFSSVSKSTRKKQKIDDRNCELVKKT